MVIGSNADFRTEMDGLWVLCPGDERQLAFSKKKKELSNFFLLIGPRGCRTGHRKLK